jgi:hypothetical protein
MLNAGVSQLRALYYDFSLNLTCTSRQELRARTPCLSNFKVLVSARRALNGNLLDPARGETSMEALV